MGFYPVALHSEVTLEMMLVGSAVRSQGVWSWPQVSFVLTPSRIVKMSSPNLNIVTLLGSCLTYSSAYLFGIQDQGASGGSSMETLIQVGEVLDFVLSIMPTFGSFLNQLLWGEQLPLSLVWALSEAIPRMLCQWSPLSAPRPVWTEALQFRMCAE